MKASLSADGGMRAAVRIAVASVCLLASAAVNGIDVADGSSTDAKRRASTETNAVVLANRILDRWEPVAIQAGEHSGAWREIFAKQLTAMDVLVLEKMYRLKAGEAGGAKADYGRFTSAVRNAIMQTYMQHASEKGSTKLGSTTSDQVFVPIVPCRVVDTRNVGGPIGSFAARNFYYFTTSASTNWFSMQGGVYGAAGSVCPGTMTTGFIPSSALATVTVTGQGGSGNLIVWQGNNPVASASTLSYPASGDTSTLATIPWGGRSGTGPGGNVQDFGVFVNAFSPANVVVDVVGYFIENQATTLDCIETTPTFANINPGASGSASAPACPTGYALTGGECWTNSPLVYQTASFFVGSLPQANWACTYRNTDSAVQSVEAWSICCRVPGR